MVGNKCGVATMGSFILLHKPEDFGTGKFAFTTRSIDFDPPESKNVADADPSKTHNYECAWLLRNLMLQPWVCRFYLIKPKILGQGTPCLQRGLLVSTHRIPKMFQTSTHTKLRIMSCRGLRNLQCEQPRGDTGVLLVVSATLFSFGLHVSNHKMHGSHTQTRAPRRARKL